MDLKKGGREKIEVAYVNNGIAGTYNEYCLGSTVLELC